MTRAWACAALVYRGRYRGNVSCGLPAVFLITGRNGATAGVCGRHLSPTLREMVAQGPVTVASADA